MAARDEEKKLCPLNHDAFNTFVGYNLTYNGSKFVVLSAFLYHKFLTASSFLDSQQVDSLPVPLPHFPFYFFSSF